MNSSIISKVYSSLFEVMQANNIKGQFYQKKFPLNRLFGEHEPLISNYLLNKDLNFVFPRIILHDQEPIIYNYQKDSWTEAILPAVKYDKRMILIHSESNSYEIESFCKDFDAIPCYWFSNGALAYEWFADQRWSTDLNILRKKMGIPTLKFKFSCLNRLVENDRIYRPILSKFLINEVDSKYLKLSCGKSDPNSQGHVSMHQDRLLPLNHRRLLDDFGSEDILINIPNSDLESGEIKNQSYSACSHIFDDTFCHIVTETLFYEDRIHLTEKSLRPFVNKKPFILVGPPKSLEYLRRYGFKTYSDFWDESYDLICDHNERLEAVMSLIKKINQMSLQDMEKMLSDMEEILTFNYNHFYNRFPNILKNELYENFGDCLNQLKIKGFQQGWMLDVLFELSQEEIAKVLNESSKKSISYSNIEPYEHYQKYISKDNQYLRNIAAETIVHYLGLDPESSKEEILARFRQVCD